ncbi:phosphotransferase-like protein [Ophiostoma piceae UAMH 11346]|uniref:Phosphotransferase-like protein n=1 Tax=Ophiostoma piceae (strain UAMH 11346) TaxID=1262450 RepID=S3BN41_OPHP1|nr:phosphotransferase-like protein [Ophiostoma piceae UAMH 11346]
MKRITAQVIAQAFHYMVEFGLCYAYIALGEALLLLNLRPEDPRTLYYHVALPGKDVSTDVANLDGAGNLYNTAIALVLSLVLMGIETPVLTQRWKQEAYGALKVWPEPYLEMEIAAKGDNDKNTTSKKPDIATPTPKDGCGDPTETRRQRKDDDDDDDSKDNRLLPPPRSSAASTRTLASRRQKRSSSKYGSSSGPSSTITSSQQRPFNPYYRPRPKDALPYYIHAGLSLRLVQLIKCVRAQLATDLDNDYEGLDKYGKYGATSMLFRIVLRPYGYSLVAKGVQRLHAWLLEHERDVYEDRHVAAQQGQLVPVCLGLLELVCEYISYTGAHVSHMLLLSYGGEPMWKLQGSSLAGADEAHVNELIYQAWHKLSALGVEHGDERAANLVWNEERQAVMCIDFGIAVKGLQVCGKEG